MTALRSHRLQRKRRPTSGTAIVGGPKFLGLLARASVMSVTADQPGQQGDDEHDKNDERQPMGFASRTLAPLRYRAVCIRTLTIMVLNLTCCIASAAPHSLIDCANFPKLRERALAAALDRCERDSKEKCRFAITSEKPDMLNPEIVPESQYQKERNGEIDTRPQEVRNYAFSEEDMQWYAQECPVVQLWAAGEVEQRSCRKVVYALMVRGVRDLHGVIEKLIRMDKAADVAHQLTSTYRFDEPTASWAQRCIQIAHEFYTLMVRAPPSGTP